MSGDAAGKPFSHIVVGTSSTPVSDSDTALAGAVAKPIINVAYNPDGHVEFTALLDGSDPAMTIQEMGLLNSAGTLCYRKIVPTINKASGASYSIQYKIKVQ